MFYGDFAIWRLSKQLISWSLIPTPLRISKIRIKSVIAFVTHFTLANGRGNDALFEDIFFRI